MREQNSLTKKGKRRIQGKGSNANETNQRGGREEKKSKGSKQESRAKQAQQKVKGREPGPPPPPPPGTKGWIHLAPLPSRKLN